MYYTKNNGKYFLKIFTNIQLTISNRDIKEIIMIRLKIEHNNGNETVITKVRYRSEDIVLIESLKIER